MNPTPPPTTTLVLLALPTELIAHVASFLPKEDILNLRLTCQRCQQIAQRAFADAFFSTVATDFYKPSLQRLERISQDDLLRPHVRTVLFAGFPHVRCPHGGRHLPGTGYYWRRIRRPSRSSPPPLNPDPNVNPVIGTLQTALAAFPNLDTLTIDPDLAPAQEPHIPTATGLCVLDVMHLALLCSARLPLRRFRILRGEISHLRAHALVPRGALAPAWGAHLVELAVVTVPVPTPAEEAEHFALVAGMIRQARALRKLVVVDAHSEFYEFLLARLLDENEGAAPPPLEVLEMRYLGAVRADVLAQFVCLFRRSLRHLYLMSAAVVAGPEWKGMLARWASELGRLRSFQVRELKWAGSDGVPDEGTVEFASRAVNMGTERVTGFRFACARGRKGERDTQRVLGKLAEVAMVEVKQRPNWEQPRGWTPLERFKMGGKLEGTYSLVFESPDPEIS
ncbi:hypothetical protein NEMBOFW57_006716 [Staphylotrichum longicolle]|uniref:F-box domain-containing protein n=1 Tax=Staphylotrichum longicolle TaxID=669026 RepID=A0AAD4EU41_9PEZI|nr:hypothetical protein NEMBOFW57_006716 [Staphylotrichum longicolle]